MDNDSTQMIQSVLAEYDLGILVHYVRNERGYCNVSYEIVTHKDGADKCYFFRQYKPTIQEEELQFEHSLILHLVQHSDLPVARVHLTRDGKSYIRKADPADPTQDRFYAIFDFLRGFDQYTWINPHCTPRELENSAITLAKYHQAVWNFQPVGQRKEPVIVKLLPIIWETYQTCLARNDLSPFHPVLEPYREKIKETIERLISQLTSPACQQNPQIIVHCDYHPGNLKFENEEVVGIFDFDWSKRDFRLFDVALALFYFCTEWEADKDGQLRLEEASAFLKAYEQRLSQSKGVSLLTESEWAHLIPFLEAANLYVLNWSLEDLLKKEVDVAEYKMYVWHGLRTWEWLCQPENQEKIKVMLRQEPTP